MLRHDTARLVNVAGTTNQVACYCGIAITNRAGFFSENNGVSCNPGAGSGTCGVSGQGIAVYGRGY